MKSKNKNSVYNVGLFVHSFDDSKEPELKDVGYTLVSGDGYYDENDSDNYYGNSDEEYEPELKEVGYTFIPGEDDSPENYSPEDE